VNQVTSSFDPAYFDMKEYSILDIQLEMLDHFLHGIFTEKGRTAYNQQKASQEL
jgi:hypothetical protein